MHAATRAAGVVDTLTRPDDRRKYSTCIGVERSALPATPDRHSPIGRCQPSPHVPFGPSQCGRTC